VADTSSLKTMYGGDGQLMYLQGYSSADTSGGGWFIVRTSSETTGTNYFDHPDPAKQWVRQEVDALEQGFVADTTALKALEIGEGKTAYLKQLSSTNAHGGGWFTVVDSAYFEMGFGVAFDHPTAAKQWVRTEYLERPSRINVKWCGAMGDDSNDDIEGITLALAYLDSINGGTVNFPAGVYLVSTPVKVLQDGVRLVGEGSGAASDYEPISVIEGTTQDSTVLQIGSTALAQVANWFEMERLLINGGRLQNICVDAQQAVKGSFRDCIFFEGDIGMKAGPVFYHNLMENVHIFQNDSMGLWLYGNASTNVFSSLKINSNRGMEWAVRLEHQIVGSILRTPIRNQFLASFFNGEVGIYFAGYPGFSNQFYVESEADTAIVVDYPEYREFWGNLFGSSYSFLPSNKYIPKADLDNITMRNRVERLDNPGLLGPRQDQYAWFGNGFMEECHPDERTYKSAVYGNLPQSVLPHDGTVQNATTHAWLTWCGVDCTDTELYRGKGSLMTSRSIRLDVPGGTDKNLCLKPYEDPTLGNTRVFFPDTSKTYWFSAMYKHSYNPNGDSTAVRFRVWGRNTEHVRIGPTHIAADSTDWQMLGVLVEPKHMVDLTTNAGWSQGWLSPVVQADAETSGDSISFYIADMKGREIDLEAETRTVMSDTIDLSGGATTIPIIHMNERLWIRSITLVYTEASSADAGVVVEVGKDSDRDFMYTGTSDTSKALWDEVELTIKNHASFEDYDWLLPDETMTLYTAGGKSGTGSVMAVVEYVVLYR
jgi:hypothetical protein